MYKLSEITLNKKKKKQYKKTVNVDLEEVSYWYDIIIWTFSSFELPFGYYVVEVLND